MPRSPVVLGFFVAPQPFYPSCSPPRIHVMPRSHSPIAGSAPDRWRLSVSSVWGVPDDGLGLARAFAVALSTLVDLGAYPVCG